MPYVIGFHWFQFFDEPREGRYFDGEDSNYGIVDIEERPYIELCEAMRTVHASTIEMHKNSLEKFPVSAIPLDGRIRPLNKSKKRIVPSSFMDPASGEQILISLCGESIGRTKTLSEQEEGKLTISFDTGNDWGVGISIFPENKKYYKNGYMNLNGFTGIEIKLSLPLNMNFTVGISEAGNYISEKEIYEGIGGSDGESFISEDLKGTGNFETYRIDFEYLTQNPSAGNNMGNKTIELQAISKIDIFIPGKQGRGNLKIESIRFY